MKRTLSLLLTSLPLAAAPITWTSAPTTITGDADIDTSGTLVYANSWGGAAATINIGGQTLNFDANDNSNAEVTRAGANGNNDYFDSAGTTISADFEAILDNFAYDGANPKVLTLNNLSPGATYQIQLFVSDDRGCCSGRTQLWSDDPTIGNGSETPIFAHGDSTYVIGTFVASAATELVYGHGTPNSQTLLNAFILQEVAAAADLDADGLPDAWETTYGLSTSDDGTTGESSPGAKDGPNGADGDFDGDGLSNIDEFNRNTLPDNPDTDGDTLFDGAETGTGVFVSYDFTTNTGDTGTNPLKTDTDGDTWPDGTENASGTFNSNTDPGTDPNLIDTDADGLNDNIEREFGTRSSDPNDVNSIPAYNPITWQTPQNITGTPADFNLSGTLIHAWSGDNNTVTVNSISTTFSPGPLLANGAFNNADPFVRADADYDALLQNANWNGTAEFFLIPGLTVGQQYTIQIWVADTRDCCPGRQKTFDTIGIGTPQVTLESGNTDGSLPSQFVLGTFTAVDTIQELNLLSFTDHPQYNAIMVRTGLPAGTVAPVISHIDHDKVETDLIWPSNVGDVYDVEYQEPLNATWIKIATGVTAVGTTTSYSDDIQSRLAPAPVPTKAFYRIVKTN